MFGEHGNGTLDVASIQRSRIGTTAMAVHWGIRVLPYGLSRWVLRVGDPLVCTIDCTFHILFLYDFFFSSQVIRFFIRLFPFQLSKRLYLTCLLFPYPAEFSMFLLLLLHFVGRRRSRRQYRSSCPVCLLLLAVYLESFFLISHDDMQIWKWIRMDMYSILA